MYIIERTRSSSYLAHVDATLRCHGYRRVERCVANGGVLSKWILFLRPSSLLWHSTPCACALLPCYTQYPQCTTVVVTPANAWLMLLTHCKCSCSVFVCTVLIIWWRQRHGFHATSRTLQITEHYLLKRCGGDCEIIHANSACQSPVGRIILSVIYAYLECRPTMLVCEWFQSSK